MGLSFATPAEHAKWLVHGTANVEMGQSTAMDAVLAYLDRQPFHWILVLASRQRGSGKSLACEWLRVRLEEMTTRDDPAPMHLKTAVHEAKMRAWTSPSLWCDCAALQGLKALKPWEREAEIDRLRTAWLVVFDDLGTEPADIDLRGVLQTRHGRGLLTLATTNLVSNEPDSVGKASKEWNARYDGRIASRMRAMGDAEAGRVTAWAHCPDRDHRGRAEPVLHAPKSTGTVDVDFDALAGPLLRATNPKVLDERAIARELGARAESERLADIVRRKVWGSLALDELAAAALRGEAAACDVLDRVARRAAGGSEG